jgi:hypothetical protein
MPNKDIGFFSRDFADHHAGLTYPWGIGFSLLLFLGGIALAFVYEFYNAPFGAYPYLYHDCVLGAFSLMFLLMTFYSYFRTTAAAYLMEAIIYMLFLTSAVLFAFAYHQGAHKINISDNDPRIIVNNNESDIGTLTPVSNSGFCYFQDEFNWKMYTTTATMGFFGLILVFSWTRRLTLLCRRGPFATKEEKERVMPGPGNRRRGRSATGKRSESLGRLV